ncbi:MAG: hypothetical protein WCI95_11785, partial [bacterium]
MRKTLAVLILASCIWVGINQIVFAQTGQTVTAEAADLKVHHATTLWDMIKSGGWAMYFLGA